MEIRIVVTHVSNSTLAGQTQRFDKPRVLIGRHPECDVAFDSTQDLTVSGHHAELWIEGGELYLKDLDSRNGTYVNQERIIEPYKLQPENTIRLGEDGPVFRVRTEKEMELDKTVAGAAAQKQLVGQATLHRVLEGVVLRERSKSKKNIIYTAVGIALVALITTTILWYNQVSSSKQLAQLKEQVRDTEQALATIRSQNEETIASKLAVYDQELQKLEGQVSQNASKFGRVMLQIQERDRLLGKLKERHDLSVEQRNLLMQETTSRLEALARELEQAEEALRVGSDDNWQNAVEQISESVFLCVAHSGPSSKPVIGTAFVLDNDGTMVASAELLREFEKNTIRLAIQNRTGLIYPIERWKIHPDYNGSVQSPAVGLIKVDSDTSFQPVRLAKKEDLNRLRVGTHLGTLGFPAELASVYLGGISARTEPVKAAIATFKDGWIGRMTNFQLETTDFPQAKLIQHSASLTDGADGSPLFLADGTVVGVHLGVETVTYVTKLQDGKAVVSKSSNPAEIGYAVRADVIDVLRQAVIW